MIGKLDEHISYIKNFISKDIDEIESLKIQFLGRKGIINDLFREFKNVPPNQKKEYGQKINELKCIMRMKIQSCLKGYIERKKIKNIENIDNKMIISLDQMKLQIRINYKYN